MAKTTSGLRAVLNKYVKEFLNYILNYLFDTIRKYVILLMVTVVALVMIIDGIRLFVESLFNLPPGVGNITIGIILVIVVLICKKFWKV